MIPSNRTATHPGVILLKEFLEPLEMSQRAFAAHLGIPVQRVNEIIKGKRGVSPETAWLFSDAFNTTPDFWLSLQASHDLSTHRPKSHIESLTAGRVSRRHNPTDNSRVSDYRLTAPESRSSPT